MVQQAVYHASSLVRFDCLQTDLTLAAAYNTQEDLEAKQELCVARSKASADAKVTDNIKFLSEQLCIICSTT